MNEPSLHAALTRLGPWPSHVLVGPGDDCAVLAAPAGPMLATVDHVIAGRHFLPGEDWHLVARKAVARSISDIAAMGGTPSWALATGALPPTMPQAEAERLTLALHHWAKHWSCPIVGGDIAATDGPVVITVTAIGIAHPSRGPVLRSTAKPGDIVYVTGRLGGSFTSGRHLTFEPRIIEARWLCDTLGTNLTAMMDLSDGLGLDATRLAKASNVRIQIDAASIPANDDSGGAPLSWQHAAGDGEDYELLLTASPSASVPSTCPLTGTPITRIGHVESCPAGTQPACHILAGAHSHDASTFGYRHGNPESP